MIAPCSTLAFVSGGQRRSEVTATNFSDLRLIGPDQYVYRLEQSNTQQAGPSATSTQDRPILGIADQAMKAWLLASRLTEGAVFRRLWTTRIGEALSPTAVGTIAQRRAAKVGLKGAFGGHSLRSCLITEGARLGISLPALMAMTEYSRVFPDRGVTDNRAARILEKEE